MMQDVLFALWFFLPAGVANMVPILVAHIPGLKPYNQPIDLGKTFRGKRIFGAHKTWRGLVFGIAAAIVVLAIQQYLVRHVDWLAQLVSAVDYAALPTLLVGALFGFGALAGDAVESFFKRQRGVAPGQGWFPFDQTDYIIGGALAVAPFMRLEFGQYLILILLWLAVHVIASYIGYVLRLKERPI